MAKFARRLGPFLVVVLLLAGVAWASRLPLPLPIPEPDADDPFRAAALEARVTRLRPTIEAVIGTSLGGPIHVDRVDRMEWAEVLLQEQLPAFTADVPARWKLFVALAGMAPDAVNRASVMGDRILVQREYWDDIPTSDLERELDAVILHELAHVAQARLYEQPQWYGDRPPEEALVRRAIVEGHAQWVARRAAARVGLDDSRILEVGERADLDPGVLVAPAAHKAATRAAAMRFAYGHGEAFFNAVVERLGYADATQRIFASPPNAIESILDPTRWLQGEERRISARPMLESLVTSLPSEATGAAAFSKLFPPNLAPKEPSVGEPVLLPILSYELYATSRSVPLAWAPLDLLRLDVALDVGLLHGAKGILQVGAHETSELAEAFASDLQDAVLRCGGRCPFSDAPLGVLDAQRLDAGREGLEVWRLEATRGDLMHPAHLGVVLFAHDAHVVLAVLELDPEAAPALVRLGERLVDRASTDVSLDVTAEDPARREAAYLDLAALARLTQAPTDEIDGWFAAESDPQARAFLLDLLRRAKRPDAPDVNLRWGLDAVRGADPVIQMAGCRLLGTSASGHHDVVCAALFPLLESPDALLRREALRAMPAPGEHPPLPATLANALLRDPDARVRLQALRSAPMWFAAALDVRAFATGVARGMPMFQSAFARKALAHRLAQDPDPAVRRAGWSGRDSVLGAVAGRLSGIGSGTEASDVRFWEAWQAESDPRVRTQAFRAVGPKLAGVMWNRNRWNPIFPPNDRAKLLQTVDRGLESDDAVRRIAALQTFAALPVDRARYVPRLARQLHDFAMDVLVFAAMGSLETARGRRAALPHLVASLEAGRASALAAEALGGWGPDATPALPALRRALDSGFAVTRLAAVDALLRIEGETPDTIQHLQMLLEDPEPGVRLAAVGTTEALEEPDPEIWALLRKALHDVPAISGAVLKRLHDTDSYTDLDVVDAEVFNVALGHLEREARGEGKAPYYASAMLEHVGEYEPATWPWLSEYRDRLLALLDARPDLSLEAARLLVWDLAERESVLPTLRRWLDKERTFFKEEAATLLGAVGASSKEFESRVLELAADADLYTRPDLLTAVLLLDAPSEAAWACVRASLENEDSPVDTSSLTEQYGYPDALAHRAAGVFFDRVERVMDEDPKAAELWFDVVSSMHSAVFVGHAERLARWMESENDDLRRFGESLDSERVDYLKSAEEEEAEE